MNKHQESTTTSSRTIVLMPGFACTSRLFEKISLPNDKVIKLEWITPHKKESIPAYAARLITPEMRTAEELILIGHSFGGVVVQEMARIIKAKKIILVSSITSKEGLSNGLHLVRYLRLHIFVNKFTIKSTIWLWGKKTGIKDGMKPIFHQGIEGFENKYLRWGVKSLVNWKQSLPNALNPFDLLGSKDNVFPVEKADNPILIEDGGHLMVYFKADEISQVINDIVQDKQG